MKLAQPEVRTIGNYRVCIVVLVFISSVRLTKIKENLNLLLNLIG